VADPSTTPAARQSVVPLWQVERDAIEAAIARFDGNIPRAAAALEISPSTIYRKRQAWAGAGQLMEQPA
jgi:two-component system repressor protein LuxO